MSEQLDVLKMVAQRLEKAAIPYMVSGSVAMNFYAQPRMTRDIDIILELTAQDSRRVRDLFAGDFYVDEEDVKDSIINRGIFNLIHNSSMVKVDCIVRKGSVFRVEEFKRRRPITLEDVQISIVSQEDLILSKLDWAKDSRSELQMKDVRNLVSAASDLDWTYLARWSKELGVEDLLREVREP